MNFISFVIGLVIFCFVLAAVLWIGFYVVLPLVILAAAISFVVSLTRKWTHPKEKNTSYHFQKNKQNQVIDVEFEEIKE